MFPWCLLTCTRFLLWHGVGKSMCSKRVLFSSGICYLCPSGHHMAFVTACPALGQRFFAICHITVLWAELGGCTLWVASAPDLGRRGHHKLLGMLSGMPQLTSRWNRVKPVLPHIELMRKALWCSLRDCWVRTTFSYLEFHLHHFPLSCAYKSELQFFHVCSESAALAGSVGAGDLFNFSRNFSVKNKQWLMKPSLKGSLKNLPLLRNVFIYFWNDKSISP